MKYNHQIQHEKGAPISAIRNHCWDTVLRGHRKFIPMERIGSLNIKDLLT